MALSFGKQASSRNDFTVPTLMQGEHDELARTSAINFARHLADRWQQLLGSDLLGLYLIGSLAHAGFSRRYSDIDVALITSVGLTPQALDHLRGEAVALSADWGTKVSVFWADRHFSLGRFPPLDRIDYLDYAIALIERERLRPPRPTFEEIRTYLRGAPFLTWADRAQPLRQLKYSSRRTTRRICGLCCTPVGFATAGSPALWAQTTTPWRSLLKDAPSDSMSA